MAYSSGGCRSIQLSYGRIVQKVIMNAIRNRCGDAQSAIGIRNRNPQSESAIRNPQYEIRNELVRPEGLEPPAYRFEACRSIQLSYGRVLRSPPFYRALVRSRAADLRARERGASPSLC